MQIRENSSARDLVIVSNERIVVDLAAIRAISEEHERLNEQIDKLAKFIMEHVEGEPSQSQGAVDTAIRLLEDRDRLQTALERIRDGANRLLEGDEQNHDIRDIAKWAHRALEDRNG